MRISMRNYKEILRLAAKPFGLLLLLVLICAFLAQVLTSSETLEEYARNNPELAYGSNDKPSAVSSNHLPAETTDIPSSYTKSYTKKEDVASTSVSENDQAMEEEEMNLEPERTTYRPGFYYQPLSEDIIARITGISYPIHEELAADAAVPAINIMADQDTPAVSYDDLRYVRVLYIDFDHKEQEGELICNKAIAQDMVEIFYELYLNEYQLERICLIDDYNGDDTLSMADNNTSCFNYRVVDGTDSLSKHAYGLAIDINPFYNPYVVFGRNPDGSNYISPPGSETYADRSKDFPYKIDENDLCYKLFKAHGFTWGGDWNSCKDYQHFQKTLE